MPLPKPLPRDRRNGMGVIHWLVIAGCLLLLLQCLDQLRVAWSSEDWPVVDAVVVSNARWGGATQPSRGSSALTVQYRVGGHAYDLSESGRTLVGENGQRLPPGATTTVRVNPRNPHDAVSFGGMGNLRSSWKWVLLFALGVPVLLAWNAWYRPR